MCSSAIAFLIMSIVILSGFRTFAYQVFVKFPSPILFHARVAIDRQQNKLTTCSSKHTSIR
ncbi:hypothetical protein MUK42_26660 [Musa troglodytarum]|uniref:Uncharacterized protein n=1 Tax=Musa troglodytarum TaxID=320322 RepID=A0A9E7F3R5_9LILI|nr:hypothetical protein MUK42_26660 [Musa troglodytarum]